MDVAEDSDALIVIPVVEDVLEGINVTTRGYTVEESSADASYPIADARLR